MAPPYLRESILHGDHRLRRRHSRSAARPVCGVKAARGSGTPSGFTVGDLDGDGRVEVATVQPEGDHPYASGIHAEMLYRWNMDHFDEVGHRVLRRSDEPDGEMRWHTGWAILSVR